MVGTHWGWPGPSLLKLTSPDYPIQFTADQLSWIVSIQSLAAIPGPLFGACVVDTIGRKYTILLLAFPFFLSWSLLHFSSTSIFYLLTARIIAGLAAGTSLNVIPIYIGEISSPQIRGKLCNILSVQLCIGVVIVYCISSYLSIESAALVYSIVPIIFFILMLRMPESPYYYIMKGNNFKARESLKALRGNAFNVDDEITRITVALRANRSEENSVRLLFLKWSNLRILLIVAGIFTIQQLAGISVVLAYSPTIFQQLNAPLPASVSGIILALVNLGSTIIAGFLVDRVGRKQLLFFSSFLTAIPVFLVATFFTLKEVYGADINQYSLIPTLGLMVYPFTHSIGLGPVPYVCMGELFHTDVKTLAALIVSIYPSLLAFLQAKLYLPLAAIYGVHTVFFCFTFVCLFGALFVLLWVPETKCRTLEEIQYDLTQ